MAAPMPAKPTATRLRNANRLAFSTVPSGVTGGAGAGAGAASSGVSASGGGASPVARSLPSPSARSLASPVARSLPSPSARSLASPSAPSVPTPFFRSVPISSACPARVAPTTIPASAGSDPPAPPPGWRRRSWRTRTASVRPPRPPRSPASGGWGGLRTAPATAPAPGSAWSDNHWPARRRRADWPGPRESRVASCSSLRGNRTNHHTDDRS